MAKAFKAVASEFSQLGGGPELAKAILNNIISMADAETLATLEAEAEEMMRNPVWAERPTTERLVAEAEAIFYADWKFKPTNGNNLTILW